MLFYFEKLCRVLTSPVNLLYCFEQSIWQDLESDTKGPEFPCFHHVVWLDEYRGDEAMQRKLCSGSVKHEICMLAEGDLKQVRNR